MIQRLVVGGILTGIALLPLALTGCGDDAKPPPSKSLVTDVVAALNARPTMDSRHMAPGEVVSRKCARLIQQIDEALNRNPDAPADIVQEVRAIRDLYAQAARRYEMASRGSDTAWRQGNGLMLQARERIEALPGASAPAEPAGD